VACALSIVIVYEVTRPLIERNRLALRERAILELLPGAAATGAFQWDDSRGYFEPVTEDAGGGDIVFATAVGDIWQRQSFLMDEEHRKRGFDYTRFSPIALSGEVGYGPETLEIEVPLAIAGYQLLAEADLPFSVVPGNHDFDAMWTDDRYPGSMLKIIFSDDVDTSDPEIIGALHAGGLDNFRSAFGTDSEFFAGKSWYVDSHGGGTSSAQVFSAGGYQFLHIGLEMSPPDGAINWARQVLRQYPGLPTIVTTHDYLNQQGERIANPIIDLAALDPDQHNSAQELFEKLIFPNDQIFLVLCGHQHGQAVRFDANAEGNEVIQVLADYQDLEEVERRRGQYAPARTHRMLQSRRMRSSEMHYLDHPLFGVIVRINRFELPAAEED